MKPKAPSQSAKLVRSARQSSADAAKVKFRKQISKARVDEQSLPLKVTYYVDFGRGVTALESFEPGDVLCQYKGTRISMAESTARLRTHLNEPAYIVQVTGNIKFAIDASTEPDCIQFGRLINHSREFNCRLKTFEGDVFLVATRKISAGEQIFYDYKSDDVPVKKLTMKPSDFVAIPHQNNVSNEVVDLVACLIQECQRSSAATAKHATTVPCVDIDPFLGSLEDLRELRRPAFPHELAALQCAKSNSESMDFEALLSGESEEGNEVMECWPLLDISEERQNFLWLEDFMAFTPAMCGHLVWAANRERSCFWPAMIAGYDHYDRVQKPPDGLFFVCLLNTTRQVWVPAVLPFMDLESFKEAVKQIDLNRRAKNPEVFLLESKLPPNSAEFNTAYNMACGAFLWTDWQRIREFGRDSQDIKRIRGSFPRCQEMVEKYHRPQNYFCARCFKRFNARAGLEVHVVHGHRPYSKPKVSCKTFERILQDLKEEALQMFSSCGLEGYIAVEPPRNLRAKCGGIILIGNPAKIPRGLEKCYGRVKQISV